MDINAFWERYMAEPIDATLDDVFTLFAQPLPAEVAEDYVLEEVVIEVASYLESQKDFEKLIALQQNLLTQPDIIKEYCLFITAEPLVKYYLYSSQPEAINAILPDLIHLAPADPETYCKIAYWLAAYQQNKAVEQMRNLHTFQDLLEEDANIYPLANLAYPQLLQQAYLKKQSSGKFDMPLLVKEIESYYFNFSDAFYGAIWRSMHGEAFDDLLLLFKQDRKTFHFRIESAFMVYLYEKRLPFSIASLIWYVIEPLLTQFSPKKASLQQYFSLRTSAILQCAQLFRYEKGLDYTLALGLLLWGQPHLYDFLLSIKLIDQTTYQKSREAIREAKSKILSRHTSELWPAAFVCQWPLSEGQSREEQQADRALFEEDFKRSSAEQTISLAEESAVLQEQIAALKTHRRYLEEKVHQKTEPHHHDKVGRNDPCPCGSGKKYKKCCGA